jgi:hypothetical protein
MARSFAVFLPDSEWHESAKNPPKLTLTLDQVMLRFLDKQVSRPDLWGRLLVCQACGWHSTPNGRWTVRNCLCVPTACPQCAASLSRPVAVCPQCETAPRFVRWSTSLHQALWGGTRAIVADATTTSGDGGRTVRNNHRFWQAEVDSPKLPQTASSTVVATLWKSWKCSRTKWSMC